MAEFPRKTFEGDIVGSGPVSELIDKITEIGPQARAFTEIQIDEDYAYPAGTFGQFQCANESAQFIEMSVSAVPDGQGFAETNTNSRINLNPDTKIKWVIHPTE